MFRNTAGGAWPRIILFDIDGTLIRARRRREYRELVREKLEEIFGTSGRIAEVDFAGKTDLAIYHEALETEGFTAEAVWQRLPALAGGMAHILDLMAADGEVFELCPGVAGLLEAMADDKRFIPSLLTGNLERLAESKLRLAGIWQCFQGRGAFGSDAMDRNDLPPIAVARFSQFLGQHLEPERFVIVGDTPRDITCARRSGLPVVAVASGMFGLDDLAACQPDAVLADLSDTPSVLELLASIRVAESFAL